MCLAQGPQRSDDGEARTRGLSSRVKHSTTKRLHPRGKIKNRYNQAPHLTQDTNWKVTNSLLDITNESQEVSPFQAGDHKA